MMNFIKKINNRHNTAWIYNTSNTAFLEMEYTWS